MQHYPKLFKFQNDTAYLETEYVHVIPNKYKLPMMLQSIIFYKNRASDLPTIKYRPSSSNKIFCDHVPVDCITQWKTHAITSGFNTEYDNVKTVINLNYWIKPEESLELFVQLHNNQNVTVPTTAYILIPKMRIFERE